jgi:hypothetical protein
MNPNKINIQDRFARFLVRNMTPIIAGTNWNEDNIGYARAINVAYTGSPSMSSYAAGTVAIRNEKDKPIANNQTFLLTDLRIGFRE